MSSSNIQLISNTIQINYIFTAMICTLLKDPSILRKGVTNLTPLIRSCSHNSWTDLNTDGLRYIFFYDMRLSDFVTGTLESIGNANIVSLESVQHNYNYPLMKVVNGVAVPVTINDILHNPASTSMHSNQSGSSGSTVYDYMLQGRINVHAIASQCPSIIQLVNYNKMINYEYEYNLIASNGQPTKKRSIIGVMKYKRENGEDWVMLSGTGISEYIVGVTQ